MGKRFFAVLLLSVAMLSACGTPSRTTETVTVTPSTRAVQVPTSTVAPITQVTLIDVVGQNGEIAQDKLEGLGLTNVGLASGNPKYGAVFLARNWTVIKMEPAPGTVVSSNDAVILTLYKD